MIKVSAPTIELALLEAGKKLGCKCIDLEYEIIEKPSGGFLGFGKKDAVIVASIKNAESNLDSAVDSANIVDSAPNLSQNFSQNPQNLKFADFSQNLAQNPQNLAPNTAQNPPPSNALISQIQSELNALFALLPIKLNAIEVSLRDKNTIFIYFTGKDAALLIGEKGYRYKALSYLLYNWLNTEYGVNMRLEIESFLANQEAMISAYLAPIIETLRISDEPFTTKPFDGVLAYIALKELRAKLKGKNIVLQNSGDDEACILITPLKAR